MGSILAVGHISKEKKQAMVGGFAHTSRGLAGGEHDKTLRAKLMSGFGILISDISRLRRPRVS